MISSWYANCFHASEVQQLGWWPACHGMRWRSKCPSGPHQNWDWTNIHRTHYMLNFGKRWCRSHLRKEFIGYSRKGCEYHIQSLDPRHVHMRYISDLGCYFDKYASCRTCSTRRRLGVIRKKSSIHYKLLFVEFCNASAIVYRSHIHISIYIIHCVCVYIYIYMCTSYLHTVRQKVPTLRVRFQLPTPLSHSS